MRHLLSRYGSNCFSPTAKEAKAPEMHPWDAARAVEAQVRLDAVPVWLEACEAYASGQQLKHELAHARFVRASYERLQGYPDTARMLLDEVLPVFRKAGDFRCTARVLRELAQPSINGDPAARTELLLESLRAAAIAGGPAMRAHVLADLTAAAFSSGNLILAARCAGGTRSTRPPGTAQSRRSVRRPSSRSGAHGHHGQSGLCHLRRGRPCRRDRPAHQALFPAQMLNRVMRAWQS